MLWQIVTTANVAISIAYFSIAWIIFSGLRATEPLGTDKLATITAMMLPPSFGVDDPEALALRGAWHWQTASCDIFGAAVATYSLPWRGSCASVLRGAQTLEDFKVRERQAPESDDNVVQGPVVARVLGPGDLRRREAAGVQLGAGGP